MERLIDDLLVLARADDRVLVNSHAPVDVDDIVLREARRLRARGRVRVDTHAVSGGQVSGDREALVRAVRNLCDNAERHARSEVSVSVRECDLQVEIVVADDGVGIPAEQREAIFERFARLDAARDRSSGGTGLGLAIVREIVSAHGGAVRAAASDTGARLVVTLPRDQPR